MQSSPDRTRGLSRECVLRIPMRVVKGDENLEVIRENRIKVCPVSELGRAGLRTLRNEYGVGSPTVRLNNPVSVTLSASNRDWIVQSTKP